MKAVFLALCKHKGWAVEPEYRFAAPRRWRFDFAIPSEKVAVEVEGGAFTNGRHTRAVGFLKDCEKYSEAAARGWLVIRVPPSNLCTAQTFDWIERAMKARAA